MRNAFIISSMVLALFSTQVWAQSQNETVKSETTTMMGNSGMMGGRNMMMQGNMKRGMMRDGMPGCAMCRKCSMRGGAGMPRGMMGHDMMGHGMKRGGMHHFMKVIYHLPDLKTQLDLTEDQSSRLKKLQSEFRKNKADWKAEIKKIRIDLDDKLEEKAAASEIRKLLEAKSKTKVDMKVSGYETARQMTDVLEPDQKKRWCNFCSICQQDSGKMMKNQDD